MALVVLTSDLMASVRVLLGVDDATLPDATLGDPLIGGAAERNVLGDLPAPPFDQRDADDQDAIRAAVAYHTAARALGTMRHDNAVTSEKFSQQYSTQRGQIDLDAWAAELRASGDAAIDHLIDTASSGGAVHFALAHGRRGA